MMQNVIAIAERHGLLIVFLNVPLPAVPTLMTVAALARQSPYQITQIILTGVSSALIAELALYWCGRHYGQRFLGLLCRLSFSPDFCVRRTEEVFARVGSWSLLFSKFIPGLTLITVAMAGVTKMPVLAFLLLDGIGAGDVSVGGAAASSAWPLAARAQQQAAKLLAAHCGGLRRRYCFTYRRRAILAVQPA
jgi:membrane protein DedA with SNARE-associated domain